MKLLLCIVFFAILGAALARKREQVSLTDPGLKKAVFEVDQKILYQLQLLHNNDLQLLSASRPAGSKKVDYTILFNVFNRKAQKVIRKNCRARILLKIGKNKMNKGEKVYYLEGNASNRVVCAK